jgi:hypothetical protein
VLFGILYAPGSPRFPDADTNRLRLSRITGSIKAGQLLPFDEYALVSPEQPRPKRQAAGEELGTMDNDTSFTVPPKPWLLSVSGFNGDARTSLMQLVRS